MAFKKLGSDGVKKVHKSRLGALIVDCQSPNDLRELAKFWGGVLGLEPDLREDQDDPRYLHLNGRPDDPKILLQRVDHPSRVHFDIETDDIDAEVMRLEKLGAKIIERVETWVVMEAPSKHRFCVINPIRSDFKDNSNQWE